MEGMAEKEAQSSSQGSPDPIEYYRQRTSHYTISYYSYSVNEDFPIYHGDQLTRHDDSGEEIYDSPPPVKRLKMPKSGLPGVHYVLRFFLTIYFFVFFYFIVLY